MGEMADFELDVVMDVEDSRSKWRSGEISHEEAYDEGVVDEFGQEYDEGRKYRQKDATCRYCGKTGLRWKQIKGKWRLFEKGKIHKC